MTNTHLLGSRKLMTGFWRFRSQTTVVPLVLVEAKICCTFRFQDTLVISLLPCAEPAGGVAPWSRNRSRK